MAKLYRVDEYGEIIEKSYDVRRDKLIELKTGGFYLKTSHYKYTWFDDRLRAINRRIELIEVTMKDNKKVLDVLKIYAKMELSKKPKNWKE